MYNPFVLFTEEVLSSLLKNGFHFLVIQRFSWPGLERATTFIVSPYEEKQEASTHEQILEKQEGKLLDISKDADSVRALLKPGTTYRLYLNIFKETNWNKRMLREYQGNIIHYLQSRTNFTRQDAIDINFVLKHGRLIAEIRAMGKELDVAAFNLINK